ncbi:MAG: alanine--glyoxylate aminotransferase family protein [Ignavibacteria bacterium]|nr:alanine--glyoxylate aminotransferase family protein [Ignavibacteria bacterium]
MKNRKLLMIPGPIEFTPEVLGAMGLPTTSHVAPNFINVCGEALELMRQVFLSPTGQPFIMAGSGTLAMDMAAANLIEEGDGVLVVNTGYFSDRFAKIAQRYGAKVTEVRASVVGDVPSADDVEKALKSGSFKIMTLTHVDTSTAVCVDIKKLAHIARSYGVLSVVDGVCSVAGEELRQDEWGVDIALTASQKAIGVPPGLALVMASPKAMEAFRNRTSPVRNFYADWNEWLPIMKAYEERRPSYFGTPAVNLVWALNVSLKQIGEEGMEKRVARHKRISRAFKDAMRALGLKQVPLSDEKSATTLSGVYYPDGTDSSLLKHIGDAGVIVAGGLHPQIKDKYFRVGHMGAVNGSDILSTIGAIETALVKSNYKFDKGRGLQAAAAILE